jgi:small-conductance mechanosensitive channel
LEQLIKDINIYLQNFGTNELIFFLIGTIVFILAYFLKLKISSFFKNLEYYQYISHAIGITILILLYYFYGIGLQFGIKIFPLLFQEITIFILIYEVIASVFKFLHIENKKLFYIIMIFTFVNVVLAFIMDIAREFNSPIGKEFGLIFLFKSLALIPISIIVYILSTTLIKYIPDKLKFFKIFLEKFHLLFNVLVILIGFLWITDIINPSINHFILTIFLVVLILLYTFVLFYIDEISKEPKFVEHFPNLKHRLRVIFTLIFLIVLYEIGEKGLEINISSILKSIYIVKTDVLTISLYSILESLILFTFLINTILILRSIIRYWKFKQTGEAVPTPAEAIIYNFGILVTSIVALSVLGITWKVLLPLIGALGIGAGFGLQSIINNYISGFILIFNKKIEVGDIVELPGIAGKFTGTESDYVFGMVMDISVINTVIQTIDGIEVAIPNSKFVSENIINYTYSNNRVRMRIPFKVAFDSDHQKVEEILLNVAEQFTPIVQYSPEKPQVWYNRILDYYDEYVLLFWINAYNWRRMQRLKSDIYKRVWEEFKKEGIKIPVINVEVKGELEEIQKILKK